jgi:hypothetical protein
MRKAQLVMVTLAVAAMCTAASALDPNWGNSPYAHSYVNTTGGVVYELYQPTSSALIGGASTVLPGAGPNGTDAYYRPGNTGGGDDSSKYFWNFQGIPVAPPPAGIPDVGQNLVPGEYAYQTYVSDYGALPHEGAGVFGTPNGPGGWHSQGDMSSWNGTPQATVGWTSPENWVGGYAWISWNNGWSNGVYTDMTVTMKWNPWGGYGGQAVSGVRFSTDGNFEVPEPVSALLLLVGAPALLRRRAR